jgi:hypothetical protein
MGEDMKSLFRLFRLFSLFGHAAKRQGIGNWVLGYNRFAANIEILGMIVYFLSILLIFWLLVI